MLEFCYLANLVAFYYLFFDPQNAVLRRVRPLAGTTSLRPAARRGCRALRSGPARKLALRAPAVAGWLPTA